MLNNDTTVSPSIVSTLRDALEADTTLGIVGPVINYMDEPETVMTEGVRFNPGPGTEFFQNLTVPLGSDTPVRVDIVNGCCMMVRAEVFRTIGLFDERLFIVHEESDFCLRAMRAGYTCGVVGRTLVWHKGSSAFTRSGRQLQRYFDARNLFYLLWRHAGKVAQSRPRVLSLWHYAQYMFYRHAVELEAGKTAAAQGVIDGICDALAGVEGPYQARARFASPVVRAAFTVRRLASRLALQ